MKAVHGIDTRWFGKLFFWPAAADAADAQVDKGF